MSSSYLLETIDWKISTLKLAIRDGSEGMLPKEAGGESPRLWLNGVRRSSPYVFALRYAVPNVYSAASRLAGQMLSWILELHTITL